MFHVSAMMPHCVRRDCVLLVRMPQQVKQEATPWRSTMTRLLAAKKKKKKNPVGGDASRVPGSRRNVRRQSLVVRKSVPAMGGQSCHNKPLDECFLIYVPSVQCRLTGRHEPRRAGLPRARENRVQRARRGLRAPAGGRQARAPHEAVAPKQPPSFLASGATKARGEHSPHAHSSPARTRLRARFMTETAGATLE